MMKQDKRQRLISKGYKIGSFSEILKLTPQEIKEVEMKLKKCKNFKRYKGIYKPRCKCRACWNFYIKTLKDKIKYLENKLVCTAC